MGTVVAWFPRTSFRRMEDVKEAEAAQSGVEGEGGVAKSEPSKAALHFQAAMTRWNGKGFKDRAVQAHHRYATYKLALALIAASKLGGNGRRPWMPSWIAY